MKKILIIDGQGGMLGKQLVEDVKKILPESEVIAVGTNIMATNSMLKAGADNGATGENAVVVCARTADIIVGPVGIAIACLLYTSYEKTIHVRISYRRSS